MDWDLAVEHKRVPLLGQVKDLLAEFGLSEGETVARVSKSLYLLVAGKLRKAESAVRRLIFVAARNIVLEPPAKRPVQAKPEISSEDKAQPREEAKAETPVRIRGKRRPSFSLFDPPNRYEKGYRPPPKRRRPEPRLQIVDIGSNTHLPLYLVYRQALPATPAPVAEDNAADDGMVDATKLIRRILAAIDALQDIPRQAMRLARWQAKPIEERRPGRWSPLRPGKPPGFRERPKHEIDAILKECDWLARNVMPPLDDTS